MSERPPRKARQRLLVPDGMPAYLAYRPSPDTVEAHGFLQQTLAGVEQKLRTSNHVPTHAALQQMVLPMVLGTYNWMVRAQRDHLEHVHHLASYLNEAVEDVGTEVLVGLAPSTAGQIRELLAQISSATADAVALEAVQKLTAIVEEATLEEEPEPVEDVDGAAGTGDEDDEDEFTEEDDGEDEDADLIDGAEGAVDDEPLFEEA